MADLRRDPELDRLVSVLNQETAQDRPGGATEGSLPSAPRLSTPAQLEVHAEEPLDALLAELARLRGSDLLLLAGLPPVVRVDGRLVRLERDALERDEVTTLLGAHLTPRVRQQLGERGSADFSLRRAADAGRSAEDADATLWMRLRVNVHRQRGELAAAIRALPAQVPTFAGLHLPASFADFARLTRGLVLVTGPTGSGKTSTLAAIVGEINRTRACHVVTIEDPVEVEHHHLRAAIEHIEVGRDTPSFADGLRAALRQDPDVILVGEMRDLETVSTALTAAETGHLILSSLHTNDAVQSVHRIVDVFPSGQQEQIRQQLALSLHAVVSQHLLPRADGRGRVPAVELVLATPPVRHHIRSGQLQKMYTEITLGKRIGMLSLEESLAALVREGAVTREEAEARSGRPDELRSLLPSPPAART